MDYWHGYADDKDLVMAPGELEKYPNGYTLKATDVHAWGRCKIEGCTIDHNVCFWDNYGKEPCLCLDYE